MTVSLLVGKEMLKSRVRGRFSPGVYRVTREELPLAGKPLEVYFAKGQDGKDTFDF